MWHKLSLLFVLLTASLSANATTNKFLATFRTGLVNGIYSNPVEVVSQGDESTVSQELTDSGFSVIPSFDASIEMFADNKRSYVSRVILAMDMDTGTIHYNYFGFGLKKYFKGMGTPESSTSNTDTFKVKPKSSMYYGYDIGMSRIAILRFGPVLRVKSTGLDVGVNWGYNRAITEDWGLNVQTGISYALGISTVSASGLNIKILFGATFSF